MMGKNGSESRLMGQFGNHCRMGCFKSPRPRPQLDYRPLQLSVEAGNVRYLRDYSSLFGCEPIHSLLANSYAAFAILQTHPVASNKAADPNADFSYSLEENLGSIGLVHISKAYRQYLRNCTIELQNYRGEDKDDVQKLSGIFYGIEVIFHLAEILNINQDQTPLLPKLQQWISHFFPEMEEMADSIMKNQNGEEPAENNPNFWPAVTGLVLIGRCKEAKNLLGMHSKKDSNAIRMLRQVLYTKPEVTSASTSAMINFGMQWDAWRREVNNQITAGAFTSDGDCLRLAELLAGDNRALRLIYESCETWYQYLVCYLTYWEPTVQSYQLSDHARSSKQMFDADRALDRILFSLFDSDLYQAIELLQEYAESGWASLHLTDLLFHAGLLSDLGGQDQKVGEKLRVDLIVQFGSLLASNNQLWQLGLSYLDFGKSLGLEQIQGILSTKDPESFGGVETLLQELRKRDLARIEQSVCSVMSKRCVRNNRLGDALMWAVKADNHGMASSISELVLREMAKNEEFSVADVLSDFPSCIACSEYLAFLVKYNEFVLKNRGDTQREAVFILMDLVNSGLSPPYFTPVLLKKAAQALETMKGELTSTDLCSLLSVLEEIVITAQISSSKDSQDALASLVDKEKEIREALAQSICRAEIAELAVK